MMQKEEAKKLLLKYNAGTCTPAEKELVEQHYLSYNESEPALSEERTLALGKEIYANLPKDQALVKPLWPKFLKIAAVFALIASASALFFYKAYHVGPDEHQQVANMGLNKAILTLANGRKINLSAAENGTLVKESGLEIIKLREGEILYKIADVTSGPGNMESHTISTPKGGQYQVSLSDGSKIWLNAASTLTYPSAFPLSKVREVRLSGEAYFEISRQKNAGRQQRPFKVLSKTQEVEVMGTHFNINAYSDDLSVKTTLLEGMVKVSSRTDKEMPKVDVVLKPNQQAILKNNLLKVIEVDAEEIVAWKNGEFIFRNEPLENIMKEISRWYDIEVVYEDKDAGKELFGGTISKVEGISEVLKMLELTGDVHFKIEGKRVFVAK